MQKKPQAEMPYVWLEMDQAALDAAYEQGVYAPNMKQILDRCATNSERVRKRMGAPRRYAYGPTPIEKLDLYPTDTDEALSPQRHIDRLNAPVIVAYGALETPEFQRHSRDFAGAAKEAGKSVRLIVGEGYNHFEMLETLADPDGLLGRTVLDLMNLA